MGQRRRKGRRGEGGCAATGTCMTNRGSRAGGVGGVAATHVCMTNQCNLHFIQLDCRVVIGCQENWPEECLIQQVPGSSPASLAKAPCLPSSQQTSHQS